MSPLRLSLLGSPFVELDGNQVKLETRKSLAILAYLYLVQREIPRERLAAMFWPEYDQQRAHGNLRRNLSSLNERLNLGWISSDREAISFNQPAELWVDITEFNHQIQIYRGHGCRKQGICPDCCSHLEIAVKLYRGDFLEGFNLLDCPEFDDWQYIERETFRNELAFCLEQLSVGYLAQQDWQKAILNSRRWTTLDRLNEAAQRALMQSYALTGNRNAALRAYDELVRLLHEELGQPPELESTQLYQRIRSGELGPDRSGQEILPATGEVIDLNEPTLKIKTFIPAPSKSRTPRSRLLESMKKSLQCPLTLISAPAGFGKTTLLAEWASIASIPVAWFSIDRSDNDPVRFMTYLVAALESVQPGIGSEALLMLRSFRRIAMQTIQASLCNRLFSSQASLALVLDDYHLIDSLEIHQSVTYLLEHLPPQMHLIVSTRSDPPFPLARFRACDQLVEIRSRDLRFTSNEAMDFLNRVMGLDLSTNEVTLLDTRTEGWVTGLQLAGLSLKGVTDPGRFIRSFSGSHHYILDYLIEEVLNRQPEDLQDFLLRTAILERLNHSLCDAITGRSDSQEVLEAIEKANLFLMPLDEERRWYRYHHLFAELLLARLQDLRPGEIPDLHRKAGLWYEAHGLDSEAIQHALIAKDFSRAADLVEKSGPSTWFRNEGITLFQWMDAIPEHEFKLRPRLHVYKAWAMLHDAHFEEALNFLDIAEQRISETAATQAHKGNAAEIGAMISVLQAIIFTNLGDASRALQEANRGIECFSESNPIWCCLSFLAKGAAYVLTGDAVLADEAFLKAEHYAQSSRNPTLTLLVRYNQGFTQLVQGRLKQAYENYERVLSFADQYRAERLHELGETHADLAWLFCEWNDLEKAESHAKWGLEIGQQVNSLIVQITSHTALARIFQARADLPGACDHIRQARQMAGINGIGLYQDASGAYEARLDIYSGNLVAASQWARMEEKKLLGGSEGSIIFPAHQLEYPGLTLVRVLAAEGRAGEAPKRLDILLPVAQSVNRISRAIEILTLRAVILYALSDLPSAWSSLSEALLLAEPQAYVRTFIDEGHPIEALLQWGIEQNRVQDERQRSYMDQLLNAFRAGR